MGNPPDFELLKELDDLLAEIDDICYIDFERVRTLAQKVQTTARQIHAPQQLARALNYEAWVLVNNRQFEQAVEKALSALEYAHRYQLTEVECRAIGIIAASFIFVRDFANGCQLHEYQRDLAARTGDNNLVSQALQDLGVVYLETAAPEDGIRLLKQAMAIAPPERYRGVVVGIMHTSLGIAYINTQQYPLAFEQGQRALDIFLKAGADYYTITAYNYFAYLHMTHKEFERADTYLAQAREIAERRNYPEMLTAVVGLIGELRWKEGNLPAALDLYSQAVKMAQQQEMSVYLVSFYAEMSQISQEMGDLQAALRYRDLQQQTVDASAFRNINRRLEILRAIFGANKSQQEKELQQLKLQPVSVTETSDKEHEAQLERMKASILERLSHEFRTPLTVIRSGTELLEQYYERLSEKQRKAHFEAITSRVTWMTAMLDDILMLLQLNRGEIKMAMNPGSLQVIVEQALNKLEALNGQIDRVEVHLAAQTAPVWLDPELLSIILIQLVGNALKFSKSTVHLRLEHQNEELRMTVTDNGIGIPPDEMDRAREIFYRASNLNEEPGYGLGLALVDQAVAAWGGTWHIRSELNVGTTVEVILPTGARAARPGR